MAENLPPKKQPAGFGSKLLNRLFGNNEREASCFSCEDEIPTLEQEENMEMQAEATAINNWQLIDEKIQECAVANEQLSGLFASISHGLMETSRTRASIDSGAFAVDSPDWVECHRYVKELEQWLQQNMEQMRAVDQSSVGAFDSLKFIIDQQMAFVVAKTKEWKHSQRMAVLGDPDDRIVSDLNLLAQWFEKTEKAIEAFSSLISQYSLNIRDMGNWSNLSPVTQTLHTERSNLCVQMQNYVQQRRHSLVQKSFIVFEQPPSIVRRSAAPDISKTQRNSKVPFDLELRVLAGETYGLRGSNVEVELLLITEKQAQEIAKKTLDPLQEKLPTPGSLLAPRVILQAPNNQSDGQMSAIFRLVRVQSMNKRTEEDSDDMYHVLLRTKPYQSKKADASQPRFWVITLPFAVLSNAHRQDKYTRARMFWQISFKINDETSLANVSHSGKDGNEIRCRDFFPALDLWFRHATHCREGLKAHWQYIADKLMIAGSNPDALVSWDAFYKKKVGDAQLSFWDWFCPIADYLAKMPAYWNSGLILGFASRLTAENLLKQATLPSMLIRFSESNPGRMVVSYVVPSWNIQQEAIIEHVLFDEKANKALEGKTLADCIRLSQDLQEIQYILPSNKPVTELFSLDALNVQQQTNDSQKSFGYVKPRVALVWRRDPPIPPDCLLNTSLDSSPYNPYDAAGSVRTTSECLSDIEFRVAGEDLENYLLSDDVPMDGQSTSGVSMAAPSNGEWR